MKCQQLKNEARGRRRRLRPKCLGKRQQEMLTSGSKWQVRMLGSWESKPACQICYGRLYQVLNIYWMFIDQIGDFGVGIGGIFFQRKHLDMRLGGIASPKAGRKFPARILLVALSVAGRRAKQPTGAPNASHNGGKNSNCRRYVQNEGDVSRWCGRITARDQPGAPDILVIFPLVSMSMTLHEQKKQRPAIPRSTPRRDRVAVQDALAELLV